MAKESMPMGSAENGISLEQLNAPGNSHLLEAYGRYSDLIAQNQVTGRNAADHEERMTQIFDGIEPSVAQSIQDRVHDHSAIKIHDAAGKEIESGNEVSENISFMPSDQAEDGEENQAA